MTGVPSAPSTPSVPSASSEPRRARHYRSTIPLAIPYRIGVLLRILGEISFEPIGFARQLGSILAEASRVIVIQALLQAHLPAKARKNLLVPLAPSSCLFLLPVALFYEPLALRVLASGARVFCPSS